MATKDEIIAEQAKQIAALLVRVSDLELQLAKAMENSSNSSKSPSSDIVKPPKKQAKRRKKAKRGGQKGRERKLREPLPPERIDETIDYEIKDAEVERYAPEVHGKPIFGPRLLATIGWMKSRAHCSYTTIEKHCDDVLQVPVSRGYP